MKRHFLILLSLLLANIAFSQSVVRSFEHDGIQREYRIYVPSIYDGSTEVPVVLNLHGYTSNAFEQEAYGDFKPIADTANFILIHPDGTNDVSGTPFWNAFGSPAETVDDIGFLSSLIDTIAANYNIDLNRVYSTGMSNGGFMSYTLACQLSEKIAAIASVTGTMVTVNLNVCDCQHPMPVMQIHGTADATVPYNGNAQGFVAVEDLVENWADFNNCNLTPTETAVPDTSQTDMCTADHFVYSGGDAGATVELYRVNGGAHTWPGSNPLFAALIGITNQDFSASQEIWRFFSQYRLNELVGVEDVAQEIDFTIYPNPSNGAFQINFSNSSDRMVEVRNTLGQLITSIQTNQSVEVLEIDNTGLYFVTIEENQTRYTKKLFVE